MVVFRVHCRFWIHLTSTMDSSCWFWDTSPFLCSRYLLDLFRFSVDLRSRRNQLALPCRHIRLKVKFSMWTKLDSKRRKSLGPMRGFYRQLQRFVFYSYWALTTVLFGPIFKNLVLSLNCRGGVLTLERTNKPDEVVPCYTGRHLFIIALSAAIFIYPAVVIRSGRCGGDVAKICGPKIFGLSSDTVLLHLVRFQKFDGRCNVGARRRASNINTHCRPRTEFCRSPAFLFECSSGNGLFGLSDRDVFIVPRQ